MEHELKMAAAKNKQLKYEFKMKSQAADHKTQLELLRLQIQLAQVNATAAATSAPAVVPTNSAPTVALTTRGLFNTPIASTSTVPATPVPTYRPPLQSYNVLSSDDGSFSGSLDGFGSKTQPWMGEDFSDENTD